MCLCNFSETKSPVSGDKNVFLPPGTGTVPFTWEFYDLFQEKGEAECPSDFLTAVNFRQFLQLKFFHMLYFEVVCPEPIKDTRKCHHKLGTIR